MLISQLTSSKIKKQIDTFEICFIFHFLIDINKDASFFLAIQKQDKKDGPKKRQQKIEKFFKLRISAYFKRFKAYQRNGTNNDFPQLYANAFKIILAALEAKIFRFLW